MMQSLITFARITYFFARIITSYSHKGLSPPTITARDRTQSREILVLTANQFTQQSNRKNNPGFLQ